MKEHLSPKRLFGTLGATDLRTLRTLLRTIRTLLRLFQHFKLLFSLFYSSDHDVKARWLAGVVHFWNEMEHAIYNIQPPCSATPQGNELVLRTGSDI